MSFFNIKDFTSGLAAKIHTILVNTDENIAVHAMTGTAGNLINPAQEDGNLASLAAKDFATQTTLSAVLTKLSADPATQTTLAALLAKDFATQTTLAAVLAKMVASPALEGGNLATIAGKDFATQTTLAAVLAKLPSTPALEGGNLATIAGKDFATQTTLAAILTKLPATPALEGGNLATIAGKDFATQTTLLAIDTLLTAGIKIVDGTGATNKMKVDGNGSLQARMVDGSGNPLGFNANQVANYSKSIGASPVMLPQDQATIPIAPDATQLANGTVGFVPVKRASISCSGSGANVILTPTAGKRVIVIQWLAKVNGATNFKWQSQTGSTDLTGLFYNGTVGDGAGGAYDPTGHFETTTASDQLIINSSAAVGIGGYFNYIEV